MMSHHTRRVGMAPAGAGVARWRACGIWVIAAARCWSCCRCIFSAAAALTMLSQMGIAIIFALSYNMLLGQTGMLSFGHAVYYGLGAFVAMHAMNADRRAQTGRCRCR